MYRMLALAVVWALTLFLGSLHAAQTKEGGVCRLLGQWHTTEDRAVQGQYLSGDITFIPLPEEKRGQFRLRQYASATPRARGRQPGVRIRALSVFEGIVYHCVCVDPSNPCRQRHAV